MKSSKFDLTAIIVLAITISISTKYVQAEKKQKDIRLLMSYGYNGRYLYDKNFTPSLKQSNYDMIKDYHALLQFLKSKHVIMPQRSEINIIDKFCSHEEELRKNGFKGIFSEDQGKPLNIGSVESKKYKQYINQNITVDEKNSNLLHYYTFMKIKEHIKFYNEANYNISNCEDKLADEFQSKKSPSRKWLSIGSSCNCGSKAEKSKQYILLVENYSSVQKKLQEKFKADEYNKLQTTVNLKRIFCHYNEIFKSIGFSGIYEEDTHNFSKRMDDSNFTEATQPYFYFVNSIRRTIKDQPHNLKNDFVVKVAFDIYKSNDKVAKIYEECKRVILLKWFKGDFITDKALARTPDIIYQHKLFLDRSISTTRGITIRKGIKGDYMHEESLLNTLDGVEDYELFLDLMETNSDFPGGKHLKNANGDNINEIRYININLYNKVIHAIPEPQINLIDFFCHNIKDLKQIGYNGILSHDIEYISNFHGLDAFSTQVKGYIRFLENYKPGIRTVRNALSEYVAYILAEKNRFYF